MTSSPQSSALASARLAARLGVEHAFIQAPMAGVSTPEMAAAVSNAGGLGSLGVGYLPPDAVRQLARRVRELTDRPFALNLFAPQPAPALDADSPMWGVLARAHATLGLEPPRPSAWSLPPFDEQVDAVLESDARVFSFTFGIPPASVLARLRAAGRVLLGTATTVHEARLLEAAGVDGIVAQGSEAGGHRGTFAGPFEDAMVGTLALVPQMVDAVGLPVVASGGLMDGRGIAAARLLGAAGVQLGTAFLLCPESGASEAYQAALRSAREDGTGVIRAFSGRPARGLVTDFSREVEASAAPLPFPLQHGATTPLRAAAAARGDARFLAMWAGQGVTLARRVPAGELTRALVADAERRLRGGG
ncbi:NAD(P)H-dependent flavin oxidoreductase [Melittangium boletus]|uniref:NAD(P)H-dependent flavin oxidoreductase n=1 Tax=Melittangium boletus TaxID=83453 RepID=UPI003DA51109